ncbi:hypothetical protein K435DRAFT_961790 [Dendrothele bispora CBS 962.96]|uniref:C2 domain-containing protein n=1 Tax=Dendrothele bispora (strain CBS 962.96) TaxID=1314807 RepID=A0A4S8MPK3_DENBC|nr:hypothetical protein K435DRAFT_961790 [Dendrothele bispora CBS 962.96]
MACLTSRSRCEPQTIPRRTRSRKADLIQFLLQHADIPVLHTLQKTAEAKTQRTPLKRRASHEILRGRSTSQRIHESWSQTRKLNEFLKLPTKEERYERYAAFYHSTSNDAFRMVVCAVCAREVGQKKDKPHEDQFILHGMILDEEGVDFKDGDHTLNVCGTCSRELGRTVETPPPLSLANNLWLGKQLIAHYYPRVCCVKLFPKNFSPSPELLQSAIRGTVTTYEQDMKGISSMIDGRLMPRPPAILASVITVSFIGKGKLPRKWLKSTFRVRRAIFGKPLYSTRIILGDLNPCWEETAALLVSDDEIRAGEDVSLMLWDSDRWSNDDLIGRVQIPVKTLINELPKNQMMRREDKLMGFEDADQMDGTLHWSIGYFDKVPLRKELELPPETPPPPPPKTPVEMEMRPGDKAPNPGARDLPPPPPDVKRTPPDIEFPSGILSIVIHQINNLERQNLRGNTGEREGQAGQDTDDPSEQSDNLPSGYVEVIINDDLVYKTRVKQYTSMPFFEAGTEKFIRDWRDTVVRLVVRDSRLREKDPILGVVNLKLADIFTEGSEVTRLFSIEEGIGFGRMNVSLLFRGINCQLPTKALGWDTGTVEITAPIQLKLNATDAGTDPAAVDAASKLVTTSNKLVVSTTDSTETLPASPSANTEAGADVTWDLEKEKLRLPVYNRYSASLTFEVGSGSVIAGLGPGRKSKNGPQALAMLWLKDLVDDEEVEVELPVIAGDDLRQVRQNVIYELVYKEKEGGGDSAEDILRKQVEVKMNGFTAKTHSFKVVGTIRTKIRLDRGLDEDHEHHAKTQARRHAFETYDHVEGEAAIAERNAHAYDDGVLDSEEKKALRRAHKKHFFVVNPALRAIYRINYMSNATGAPRTHLPREALFNIPQAPPAGTPLSEVRQTLQSFIDRFTDGECSATTAKNAIRQYTRAAITSLELQLNLETSPEKEIIGLDGNDRNGRGHGQRSDQDLTPEEGPEPDRSPDTDPGHQAEDVMRMPGADDDDDDDDEREPRKKKVKQDPTKFGWTADSIIKLSTLSQRHKEVIALVENYTADIDYSIEHLESSGANPYLPRKQWKAILRDQYVELSEVLAAITESYHSGDTQRPAGSALSDMFEGTTIAKTAPSKPVMDQTNWRRAWRAASEAIICAFPHRRGELDRYENHIQRLFESHIESTHSNIIRYDRAVRTIIGNRKDLLYDDYDREECSRLKDAYISTTGTFRTAHYTEIDEPLPRPPAEEFQGAAWDTIKKHPHLFQTHTPIDPDKLKDLLSDHPNKSEFPETWDNSWAPLPSDSEQEFINNQCEAEVEAQRHSPAFGPDLLPGMYSTPNIAVPKPRSEALRLVANQSAGEYCQNNMIDRDQTRGREWTPYWFLSLFSWPSQEHTLEKSWSCGNQMWPMHFGSFPFIRCGKSNR